MRKHWMYVFFNFISDSFAFSNNRWNSLKQRVRKQYPTLLVVCQQLHDTILAPNRKKAEKLCAVWLPLLKVLASFNSICPLIPQKQVKQ